MRVENSRVTPPGGWQWRSPDGVLHSAYGFDTFMDKVRKWHEVNGTEFDVAAFEDALCRALDIEDSHCGQPPKLRLPSDKARAPTLGDLKNFLKLLIMRMGVEEGERVVSQAEAEYRASICRTCPMNRKVDGCLGCGGVLKLVKEAVGAGSTSYDGSLESCAVCSCYLRAKVWVNKDLLLKVEEGLDREYPEHCWMRG